LEILQQPITIAPSETIEVNINDVEKTTQNIVNALKDTSVIKKVTIINTELLDNEVVSKNVTQLKSLTKRYNTSITELNIGTSKQGSNGICLKNPLGKESIVQIKIYGNEKSYYDKNDFYKDEYFPFNSKVDIENESISTITHEFAHSLWTEQQMDYVDKDDNLYLFGKEIKQIRKKYNDEFRKNSKAMSYLENPIPANEKFKDKENKTYDELQQRQKDIYISGYAETNNDEWFAEAFKQGQLNKNPSPYSKEVVELVDKYFKKGDSNDT
jgi:hypothetical protein